MTEYPGFLMVGVRRTPTNGDLGLIAHCFPDRTTEVM